MKTPCKLKNTIQEYAWGSPDAIPGLLGFENPDNTPMAELWMGAHPKAPSVAVTDAGDVSLDKAIADSPEETLGNEPSKQFDGRLPFLFKVLAAGAPLSIQAHPNLEQARQGYARENQEGIPIGASERNYRDPNHKPEIMCALTPFWAMCGFRPEPELDAELHRFSHVPLVSDALAALRSQSGPAGVKAMFSALMTADEREKREAVARVVDSCANMSGDRYEWVVSLNEHHRSDIGVICPLILNLFRLEPGRAIYLEAGVLHAYLSGTGIELMANSDNVLRGGLTRKHVDVPELLGVLGFHAERPTVLAGESVSSGVTVYETPNAEFSLSRIRLDGAYEYLPETAEILLCTEGDCALAGAGRRLQIRRGASVFVPAATGPCELEGSGVLYRASIPVG